MISSPRRLREEPNADGVRILGSDTPTLRLKPREPASKLTVSGYRLGDEQETRLLLPEKKAVYSKLDYLVQQMESLDIRFFCMEQFVRDVE